MPPGARTPQVRSAQREGSWAGEILGTLPHTHIDILHAKPLRAEGWINRAGASSARARVGMLPGDAGINVRKTARYAGKDCDPLQRTSIWMTWIRSWIGGSTATAGTRTTA